MSIKITTFLLKNGEQLHFFCFVRFNHSCNANAMAISIDCGMIRTQRKIKKGEEITVNRLSLEIGMKSVKERNEILEMKLFKGSGCKCALCVKEASDTTKNENYKKFAELQKKVEHCTQFSNLGN